MKRYLSTYTALVLAPVAIALCTLILLTAHATTSPAPAPDTTGGQLMYRLLLATCVVVAVAALGGAAARRLGQPAVVGELTAGLALGPTALGALAPQTQQWIFPNTILPHLDTLAQFGVVFFMFLVGAELPAAALRRSGPAGLVIGHASIALPFLTGLILAWWLYRHYPPTSTGLLPFLLFIALSLSITAFPVLARILAEHQLLRTPLGATGMTAAGIGDVTAWALLALVIAVVRGTNLLTAALAIIFVTLFAALMLRTVKPLIARAVQQAEKNHTPPHGLYAALVTLILATAYTTDRIGVHAIFGPFIAGVIMPRNSALIKNFTNKIQGITTWFMLPLFFVTIGLNTQFNNLNTPHTWLTCLLITLIAITAKITSATAAATMIGGHTRREALALGTMMNCRGLTELVVLNLGVQLGILGPELFAMFVLMALITTAMTGPLLHHIHPQPQPPPPPQPRPPQPRPGPPQPKSGAHNNNPPPPQQTNHHTTTHK